MKILYISIFGVIGVLARYFLGLVVIKAAPSPFPLSTLLINILGSFLIGVIYVLGIETSSLSEDLSFGIIIGFLGGFTTFSTYALEAARLMEEGHNLISLLYLFVSPVIGLIAAFGGLFLARYFSGNINS